MSTAQEIFIAYGTLIAAYGFFLGIPLSMVRKQSPQASRHLVNAHLSAIMQSSLHFGFAFAVGAVGFESTLATVAATLLALGTALEAAGSTTNWLTTTGDQFGEKSWGFYLNSMSGPPMLIGICILAWGILSNL